MKQRILPWALCLLSLALPSCSNGAKSDISPTPVEPENLIELSTPTHITLENGNLYWDEVKGSKGYDITLINSTTNTYHASQEKVYLRDDLEAGENKVTITALGDHSLTKDSPKGEITLQGTLLSKPEISIQDSFTFSWSEEDNASYYLYNLNDEGWLSTRDHQLTMDTAGSYSLKVKAAGSYTGTSFYLDSLEGVSLSPIIKAPLAPTNLDLKEGILSWDKTIGADSYAVYLDGKALDEDIKETSFDVSSYLKETSKKLSVKAGAMKVYGKEATYEVHPTLLGTPKVTFIQDDEGPRFTWNKVNNAISYEVVEDGKTTIDTKFTEYIPETDGSHSIQVKAKSHINGHNFFLDSPLSKETEKASFPLGPSIVLKNDNTITISKMEGASSYALISDGEKLASDLSADTTINPLHYYSKTGIYSLRARGYDAKGKALATGAPIEFNTGRIGEHEIYSFDDAPDISEINTVDVDIELEKDIIHGEKGYSLKTTTTGESYCHIRFPLDDRIYDHMQKCISISYWAYLVKPEGYDEDYAGFFGFYSNFSNIATGGYDDPVFYEGKNTMNEHIVPYGKWVKLTMYLDANNSFSNISNGIMDFNIYPSDPTYAYGANYPVTIYLDDMEFTWQMDPSETFSTYMISNGTDDPKNTLHTWSYKGVDLKPNTSYEITVDFSVMQGDGTGIVGAGMWGRRIQWNGAKTVGTTSFYGLAVGQSAVGDPSFVKDGVHQLPSPSDICSTTFTTTTDKDGKIRTYLIDFNSGEIVGIHKMRAKKAT